MHGADPARRSLARRTTARYLPGLMGSRSALRHKPAISPPPDPDPVLEAMARELRRSMEGFDVPGSPRPYFMAYSLRRVHALRLRAAYGSLLRSRDDRRAGIYCEVRVGDHHFDALYDASAGHSCNSYSDTLALLYASTLLLSRSCALGFGCLSSDDGSGARNIYPKVFILLCSGG